ncbi:MAG: bifunctional riboflavin kinase/FAD synthetase [Flavobacteriales bacterium]|nr:bifunctional riboflavin kinase/FAD synthetase [Flavobacteriales bacterium]NQX96408.1 bifunctional riboflavin kinase/FAD synthetase [Flavobacteriales bacterium]
MKVYNSIEAFKTNHKTAVTIGTFDGVHIGHKVVINQLKNAAKKINGESVILTFFPHPRMVLYPDDNELRLLNTIDERFLLLEKAGIDHLIIHPFSKEFSRLSSTEFVRDILVNQLNVSTLVIGYDHHFGRNREGSFEHLQELSPLYGFHVEEISAQEIQQVNISSTKIRYSLLNGEIHAANQFLSYNYFIKGTVVKGEKIGRTIGFPTANIKIDEWYKLIPTKGVYAVKIKINETIFIGMLNIGSRPTLKENSNETIEVNIFNFDEEIYNKKIEIEFYERIRDEQKFENISELKKQLEIDKQQVIQIFN